MRTMSCARTRPAPSERSSQVGAGRSFLESLFHTAEARGAETTPSCLPPSVALIVSELDSGCETQKEKLASHGASVPALPKATLFCSGPSSTRIAQHASPPDLSSSSRRRTLRRGWEGAPGRSQRSPRSNLRFVIRGGARSQLGSVESSRDARAGRGGRRSGRGAGSEARPSRNSLPSSHREHVGSRRMSGPPRGRSKHTHRRLRRKSLGGVQHHARTLHGCVRNVKYWCCATV